MADAYGTSTTGAEYVPQVWSKIVQLARESTLILGSEVVRRFDMDVAEYGNIINVPNVSNFTAGNISTADGTLNAVANTDSLSTITINQWTGCVVNNLDILLSQSKYDLASLMGEKIGYALGVNVEDYLTAFAPSFANNVGTYNTPNADADFRRAVQYLDDARVPFPDRHLVLKPAGRNNLLSIDKFVNYYVIPRALEENPILKGNVGELYGVQVHITPEVYLSGSNTSNFMCHRDAIGLAMQKEIKMEEFARIQFSKRLGGSQLYGASIMRNDHGVEVRS